MNFIQKILTGYLQRKGYTIGFADANLFTQTFANYFGTGTSNYQGWVAACADIWGKFFAKTKFRLYDSDTGDEILKHPLIDTMKRPNKFQTFWEIKYRIAQNFIIYGNSYLLKVRDGLNVPRMFVQLHPDRIQSKPYNIDSIESYEYNTGSGTIALPVEDVIHLKYPDPVNHIKGRPVINSILDPIEVDKFQTAYQKKFYKEGGFYGATFSTDQKMTKDNFNLMKQELQSNFGGGSVTSYKIALFEQGLKPIPGAYSIKDMDIASQRKLTQQEICAAFQVNKLFFGESELIQRGNADTIIYLFCTSVIDPIMDYIDDVLTAHTEMDYGTGYYVKHDEHSQRDIEGDILYFKAALGEGGGAAWLEPDEVREAEGYKPSPALTERFYSQKNNNPPAITGN